MIHTSAVQQIARTAVTPKMSVIIRISSQCLRRLMMHCGGHLGRVLSTFAETCFENVTVGGPVDGQVADARATLPCCAQLQGVRGGHAQPAAAARGGVPGPRGPPGRLLPGRPRRRLHRLAPRPLHRAPPPACAVSSHPGVLLFCQVLQCSDEVYNQDCQTVICKGDRFLQQTCIATT